MSIFVWWTTHLLPREKLNILEREEKWGGIRRRRNKAPLLARGNCWFCRKVLTQASVNSFWYKSRYLNIKMRNQSNREFATTLKKRHHLSRLKVFFLNNFSIAQTIELKESTVNKRFSSRASQQNLINARNIYIIFFSHFVWKLKFYI